MAVLIDGRKVAEDILKPLRPKILKLQGKGIYPCLAIMLVGNNPESKIYIRQKIKKANEIGVKIKFFQLEEEHCSEKELIDLLAKLNADSKVHGIVLQLPLPSALDTESIIKNISLKKDVDGLNPNSPYPPACAAGIMKILDFYKIEVKNKKVIILGAGRLVGRPLFNLMQKAKAEVAFAKIKDLRLIRSADILVGALPISNVIQPEMVKKGAVVIDAAGNVASGTEKIASYLTPRIGGVGPVTVAMLLKNVVEAVAAGT